jgi:hypothetical protein
MYFLSNYIPAGEKEELLPEMQDPFTEPERRQIWTCGASKK